MERIQRGTESAHNSAWDAWLHQLELVPQQTLSAMRLLPPDYGTLWSGLPRQHCGQLPVGG